MLDSTGYQTLHHAAHGNIMGMTLLGFGNIPQLTVTESSWWKGGKSGGGKKNQIALWNLI